MSEPYSTQDLMRVMQRLRDPENGCPWYIAQDFDTIVPSTLEECYELVAAIEQGDFEHVAEELGDVLFQVIFYAQLGAERGLFDFSRIVDTLVGKLVRRHPHVFANGRIEGIVDSQTDVAQVKETWEAIKQQERAEKSQHAILADIPVALPALPRAQKLQKRASGVGFDWAEPQAVLEKIDEELLELRAAIEAGDAVNIDEELGDVLFSVTNLARHLKLDAETSLRRSSSKFEQRFVAMEAAAKAQGRALDSLSEAELDGLWEQAKRGC